MDEIQRILAVALGSALGGAARYGVGRLAPHDPVTGFPWGTFGVNVVGSLVLCVILGAALTLERAGGGLDPRLRLFLATGVCGGFTTFSTFALEMRTLLELRSPWFAAIYALASVAVGLAAGMAGVVLGRRLAG